MVKVFYIREENFLENEIDLFQKPVFLGFEFFVCDKNSEIETQLKSNQADIVLLNSKNVLAVHECQKIKSYIDKEQIQIVVLVPDNEQESLPKIAHYYSSTAPAVLCATLQAAAKNRKNLIALNQNNADLQKSLYQLDALYHTSFQLAGELNKNNLINIMTSGIEKSLSYNLSYAFIFEDNNQGQLIINSLQTISPRLEKALKLRAVLNYKGFFDNKKLPFEINFENIKTNKIIKYQQSEYDLNIFKFDNLFSPITIGNKFFGIIEIFKENDFTSEDATCFQTLTKQVSIPLESALLYEEISNTNKKLERLERLKSEFISIVSHELRTPLTAIKNSLDILLSGRAGELNENGQKFLNNAKRNVVRLSSIINDLLDLSKIEAGKMELHFDKIELSPILEFMKTTFASQASEKNIELILKNDLPQGFDKVYADSIKLEQIISNLLSNALKFTPEGGQVKIEAKLCNKNDLPLPMKTQSEQQILLTVKDTGIGIKEDDLEKVFDEFKQIENPKTRKIGGTGLGLPIARQLTYAHKGDIQVQSELDKGTIFWVSLPSWSDEIEFQLKVDSAFLKAQIHKTNVTLLKIKEFENKEFSLIDEIEKTPSLLTTAVPVVLFKKNNELTALLAGIDEFATDFIIKKMEAFLLQKRNENQRCTVVYSRVTFPRDEKDPKKLLTKLEENYKKFDMERL